MMTNYNNTSPFPEKCESKGDLFSIAEPYATQDTPVTATYPVYTHPGTYFSFGIQAFQEGILQLPAPWTKN